MFNRKHCKKGEYFMMLITSMRLFLLKRKEASLAIQFTFPTRVRFDCVGVRMGFSTVSEHFQCTGWPKSKFANSNGYNSENIHFWPHVGKAKVGLGCLSLFLEIVNKQLKIVNKQLKIQNKLRHPKHILALPTWGQKLIFPEL